jgi:hypothetical protein
MAEVAILQNNIDDCEIFDSKEEMYVPHDEAIWRP